MEMESRRKGHWWRRRASAVLCAVLMAVAVSGFGAGAGAEDSPAASFGPRGHETRLGGSSIRVSVRPSEVGPLSIRISRVRTRGGAEGAYLVADLTFRNNASHEAVMKDVFRTSSFADGGAGDSLLVADEGCGYVINGPGAPVMPGACQAYLDFVDIRPGRVGVREITALRDLRGMSPLTDGRYTFDRHIRFRFGRGGPPTADADLTIAFDVVR